MIGNVCRSVKEQRQARVGKWFNKAGAGEL
jgi:hypothetical protein